MPYVSLGWPVCLLDIAAVALFVYGYRRFGRGGLGFSLRRLVVFMAACEVALGAAFLWMMHGNRVWSDTAVALQILLAALGALGWSAFFGFVAMGLACQDRGGTLTQASKWVVMPPAGGYREEKG